MPRVDSVGPRQQPQAQPSQRNSNAKTQSQAQRNSEVTSKRRVERNSSAQSRRAAQAAPQPSEHRAAIPNGSLGRNLDVTA